MKTIQEQMNSNKKYFDDSYLRKKASDNAALFKKSTIGEMAKRMNMKRFDVLTRKEGY